MAMNHVQFLPGMSLPEFLGCYGTETACAETVMSARWPDGFACPPVRLGCHCVVSIRMRPLFQCNACRLQTSVTAGTLFAGTKLPLKTWFLATYLISQAKIGLSALALNRQMGVSYPTGWPVHQKIISAMAQRENAWQLSNVVQLDNACLGGERSGGTPGRGSENKLPFVAAVSLNEKGRPQYLRLTQVASFAREAIKPWAQAHLATGTIAISDGLGCFVGVIDAGCWHLPIAVGGRKPRDTPEFAWVNSILGNLKTTPAGAHHAFK